jgi:hypothetical protein
MATKANLFRAATAGRWLIATKGLALRKTLIRTFPLATSSRRLTRDFRVCVIAAELVAKKFLKKKLA